MATTFDLDANLIDRARDGEMTDEDDTLTLMSISKAAA